MKGADWFVEGAADIAKKMGIPQLIIGLTIVAMRTSIPDFQKGFKGTLFFFFPSVFYNSVQRRIHSDLHDVDEHVSHQKYVSGVPFAESADEWILCYHGKKFFLYVVGSE